MGHSSRGGAADERRVLGGTAARHGDLDRRGDPDVLPHRAPVPDAALATLDGTGASEYGAAAGRGMSASECLPGCVTAAIVHLFARRDQARRTSQRRPWKLQSVW